MYLHELESSKNNRRKRVGRGPGSGSGKNCGRGQNGAKSRSGYKRKRGFEGGQNPLSRRLPKFGFTSPNKVYAQLINLQNLEDAVTIETGSSLDKAKLKALGLIKKEDKPVKLLGKGKLSKKLSIEVDMASLSAVEAVKSAGGNVLTLS
ncbi:MAG: 50S ribosomal protein L15 [SAR324 cluster bacterium]|nr:50S ribosomal protein L15 [SAR324 cluster bacterium]MBL7034213.1 50S ribosomal protein L15 [SAR324 cluster bacterium]